MNEIRQSIRPAVRKDCVGFNRVSPAYARESVLKINLGKQLAGDERQIQHTAQQPANHSAPATGKRQPDMYNLAGRGQKTPLGLNEGCRDKLNICFGWKVSDSRCDMDASAFLLNETGRVPGDDWFVFYGHTLSPDGSTEFRSNCSDDMEIISLDFSRLNPGIKKLVFVLTLNEALENGLNFSMIRDAYIRILNAATNREIVSFKVSEYYSNVTSMTIGEIYLHNGQWRFNPVGNGVNKDLAGQCMIYGVDIV